MSRNGAFLVALAIGLLGSIAVGLVLGDPIAMGVAMVLVGGMAGLVTGNRPGAAGVATGVAASVVVLTVVDVLTPLRTIVNIQPSEVGSAIVLLVPIWALFVVAALSGFAVASFIGRRFLL